MVNNISILGSTGSIGTQALCVAEKLGIKVSALSANKNIALLEEQVRKFKPHTVAVFDEFYANKLKANINDLDVKVVSGIEGLCEVATIQEADIVLNSVVGMIGLVPTIEAIKAKKDIALANKETLVTGGELVMKLASQNGVKILPVDSEHSAIFQCLQGINNKSDLKSIILTASGGPFYGKTKSELSSVTVEQALSHPTWNMGAKITIDSATMMNKGLEIIEAKWLFDVPVENINVVIHKQSIVHSLIECVDNSVIAQLGVPDMKIPIQYALTYPERYPSPVQRLDLTQICNLTFLPPDEDTFLCMKACKEAIKRGGLAPVAANGANEEAVQLFLDKKISFLDIGKLVYAAMSNANNKTNITLEDILKADTTAREYVKNHTDMR